MAYYRENLNIPRQPRTNLPVLVQSSPLTNEVSSSTNGTPNIQKTGRSIIIQLLSWGIAIPVIFPVTALLTRHLGPTQYGEYSFTFTFFAVVALFSGTGMDQLFVRRLTRQARTEWGNTLSYALGTRLLSTALSGVMAIMLVLVLPISTEQRDLLLVGSVWLFFSFSVNTLRVVYSYGFVAEQQVGILSLLITTNRVITAGLVVLVVLLRLPLLWTYTIIMYSDLPFFIILMILARRRFGMRLRFSLAHIRENLLSSLPLTGYDALALLGSQGDLILLRILSDPLSVGFYALATRITDPLLSVVFAYLSGLYPLLCTKFEEGHKQFSIVYQEAVRILALTTIPLAIFVSVNASTIVTLLGGRDFAPAAIAVQLLMWSMAATFFSLLAVRTCTAANLERRVSYLSVISVAINIVANLILIPQWQFIGAAVASLLSQVISLCVFNLLLRHQIHLLRVIGVLLRVFLGNLPMLIFLLWQQQASLLLTVPVALLLCIIGCIATRTLSTNDVFMVRRVLFTKRSKEISKDVADQPTLIIPRFQDIADWPTISLPRV